MFKTIDDINERMLIKFEEAGIEDSIRFRIAFLKGALKALEDREFSKQNFELAQAVRTEINVLKTERHTLDTLF